MELKDLVEVRKNIIKKIDKLRGRRARKNKTFRKVEMPMRCRCARLKERFVDFFEYPQSDHNVP